MSFAISLTDQDFQVLCDPITDLDEALRFCEMLFQNSLLYHFEDDPKDVLWSTNLPPTAKDLAHLTARVAELYSDDLDWSEHGECPIGYCLRLLEGEEA